jgi:N-acyl-L-homoserine lactone synthetase
MLHILDDAPDHLSNKVLRNMFAARKSIFVDLLGWDVPVLDGRFEIDQFDDPHATYLVVADGDGDHLGSTRLLPTMRPHILGHLYPGLCEDAPPTGPAISEITRFCLDRRLRARERRIVRDTLVTALVDHALDQGITTYSAIAEMGWFQQILAFGWRCRPLGLPQIANGSMLAALRIDVTRDTPGMLAAAGIVASPSLLGIDRPIAA